LISIILLLLKHNSKDYKGTESTFKDQALNLIKKILKKKPWSLITVNEDWVCLKRGLMIYFGNKINWNKEVYRIWREYITEAKIRDEMIKESSEIQTFV
jgi:hypothetical protein